MLWFFVVFMYMMLRFWQATGVCWTLYALFFVGNGANIKAEGPNSDYKPALSVVYMIIANVTLMFAAYFTEYWKREDFARHFLLLAEEQRTRVILEDLLPTSITRRIQQAEGNDVLIADEFESVSILFSDIKGFTAFSAQTSAQDLVLLLNTLYTNFDFLIMKHQVGKRGAGGGGGGRRAGAGAGAREGEGAAGSERGDRHRCTRSYDSSACACACAGACVRACLPGRRCRRLRRSGTRTSSARACSWSPTTRCASVSWAGTWSRSSSASPRRAT